MTTESIQGSTMTRKTASDRLAEYVGALRFDDLPRAVVERVKDLCAEHLAVAFSGCATERGRWAVRLALEMSAGATTATMIGQTARANVLDAVFANAVLIGGEDIDDFLFPGGVHPGRIVFPAAFALAEQRGSNGRELIAAIVVGYDTMCRLSNTIWAWGARSARRPQAPFAPFGAAAAAARMLGLDRERTADALGHAAHFGMGLIGGVEHQWPLQGMLAKNGVTAALAAATGARGSRTIIEDPGGLFATFFDEVPAALEDALATLGRDHEVMRASLKRYPGSGFNVIPQQLMLGLVTRADLRDDDVVGITITVPEERRRRETVMEHEVSRGSRAIGSVRFLLAAIITQRAIDPHGVTREDPRVQALLGRTRIAFEAGRPLRYARVEVETARGESLVAEADDHAFPPLDRGQRLRQYGSSLLPGAQLDRLERLISRLDEVEDVRELIACVTRPAS